jgi:hypothetical protein
MNRAKAVVLLCMFLLLPALMLCQTPTSTLRGTVTRISHPNGTGTHVWLESAGKTQEVCLGGTQFLSENQFSPKVGDVLEVRGVNEDGLFVADNVSTGGRTLGLSPTSTGVSSWHHHGDHDCCDHHHHGHHDCGHGDHHSEHE